MQFEAEVSVLDIPFTQKSFTFVGISCIMYM